MLHQLESRHQCLLATKTSIDEARWAKRSTLIHLLYVVVLMRGRGSQKSQADRLNMKEPFITRSFALHLSTDDMTSGNFISRNARSSLQMRQGYADRYERLQRLHFLGWHA